METRSGSAVLPRSDPFHSLSNTPVPSEEVIHSFLRLVVCVFGVKDLSPAVRVGACVCLCQIRTSCFFLEGRGGRKRSRWMIREAFCVWFGSVRFCLVLLNRLSLERAVSACCCCFVWVSVPHPRAFATVRSVYQSIPILVLLYIDAQCHAKHLRKLSVLIPRYTLRCTGLSVAAVVSLEHR